MPRAPLLNIELTHIPRRASPASSQASPIDDRPPKPWTTYIPLAIAVLLILMPQPSFMFLIINQHYRTYGAPWTAARHLVATAILTLLTLSSLIVCCARDPGQPHIGETVEIVIPERQGLMQGKEDDDFNSSRKWCRACWAPKHERTHHCSTCGRCVLKMDHHCPWLANKCVGHRTYPAFLHLLLCITLLALYMGAVAVSTIYWYMFAPVSQALDDPTPIHALFLSLVGVIFAPTFASFLGFHVYLCLTNQTTLENLSPFLLLRYLPAPNLNSRHVPGTSITNLSTDTLETPLDSPYRFPSPPPSPLPILSGDQNRRMNRPWEEHELSYAQRRAIRRAHGRIRLYDIGWKRNLAQVFGRGPSVTAFLAILLYGGNPKGDGKRFEFNYRARPMLEKLADELMKIREQSNDHSDATHNADGSDQMH